MMRTVLGAGVAAALCFVAPAMADDWTAQQLRGQVLQLIAKQWQPLNRGDVVPDDRVIRTLGFGRVTFVRGNETIELGPNTQIQIHDRGGAKPFTTVTEYFGSVGVEAEVENVQHFAVDTKFLAAVVKGTKFVVTVDNSGATVSVTRGHVAVDDHANHQHVTITVGQSATVDSDATGGNLDVSGSGVLPVVLDKNDDPVPNDAAAGPVTSSGKGSSGKNGRDGKGNSGNGSSGGDRNSGDNNSGKGSSGGNGNSGDGSGGSGGNSGSGGGDD